MNAVYIRLHREGLSMMVFLQYMMVIIKYTPLCAIILNNSVSQTNVELFKSQVEKMFLPEGTSSPETRYLQRPQSCYCEASAAPVSQVLKGHFLAGQLYYCI